jgi:preprotein translocase subunit SecE
MKDLIRYFTEVKLELGKVVWPSRDELIGSVIVVLMLVCAFSIYLGALDLVFYRIAERVF